MKQKMKMGDGQFTGADKIPTRSQKYDWRPIFVYYYIADNQNPRPSDTDFIQTDTTIHYHLHPRISQ